MSLRPPLMHIREYLEVAALVCLVCGIFTEGWLSFGYLLSSAACVALLVFLPEY